MKMKRILILLLCTVLMFCFGCGYEPVTENTRAAFACFDHDSAYAAAMADGIRDALGEGATLDVYALGGNAFVEDALAAKITAQGYDVVFIRGSGAINDGNGSQLAYQLEQAQQIGAVVIVEQCMTNDADQIIEADEELAGQLSMQILCDAMDNGGNLLLLADDKDYSGKLRLKGAQAVRKETQITVCGQSSIRVELQRGETLRLMRERVQNEAYHFVLDALSSDPTVDGIWAMNDSFALGAVQALDELGLQGQIPVVCVGASLDILDLVQDGTVLACVAADPYAMGHTAAQIYLAPDTKALFWGRKTTGFAPIVIDAENLEVYMEFFD